MRGVCAVLLIAGCSFRYHATTDDGAVVHDAVQVDHPDAPHAMPALVQQAIAAADNSNDPLTATLPARPTAGDLLVMIGACSRGGLASVSGGGVATWTRATQALANVNIELWYGISDGSSAAVTITHSPYGDPIWQLATEWSGVAATGVLDTSESTSGTTSPASAGSAAATAGDLTLFAVANLEPNTFGTPTQGTWTALMPASSSTTTQQAWYMVAPSAGQLAPSVTETAHSWEAAIATFHAAP